MMVKIDEETTCHFFPDEECKLNIPEDVFKEMLENSDDYAEISYRPNINSEECTNCLLSQIVLLLRGVKKDG